MVSDGGEGPITIKHGSGDTSRVGMGGGKTDEKGDCVNSYTRGEKL